MLTKKRITLVQNVLFQPVITCTLFTVPFQIDDMQDEIEEMLEMNNEIQDVLSRQYDTPDVSSKNLYLTTIRLDR